MKSVGIFLDKGNSENWLDPKIKPTNQVYHVIIPDTHGIRKSKKMVCCFFPQGKMRRRGKKLFLLNKEGLGVVLNYNKRWLVQKYCKNTRFFWHWKVTKVWTQHRKLQLNRVRLFIIILIWESNKVWSSHRAVTKIEWDCLSFFWHEKLTEVWTLRTHTATT